MTDNTIKEIMAEREWRDNEFANIKIIYNTINESYSCQFLKMCVPIIYAHWEGFLVSSLTILIKHLNDLNLKSEQININILTLKLDEKLDLSNARKSFGKKCEFSKLLVKQINKELKLTRKCVNTKSNLKYDVLECICEQFGFNESEFEKYKLDINKIVDIRNSIAHGENAYNPDFKNIEEWIEVIKNLMEILILEINQLLKNKTYLK